MKLNNHGWGLREMIIYSCLLLFCLLIAAYNINYLYSGLNNKSNDQSAEVEKKDDNKLILKKDTEINKKAYELYEQEMIQASKSYLKDYSYDLNDTILTIDLETLINFQYIEKIYDQVDQSICTGYVNVFMQNENYKFSPVLKCSNYVSTKN